jgi:hypothetical protein
MSDRSVSNQNYIRSTTSISDVYESVLYFVSTMSMSAYEAPLLSLPKILLHRSERSIGKNSRDDLTSYNIVLARHGRKFLD